MMKIAVSGTSGFIGSALCEFLSAQGYSVVRLVRNRESARNDDVYWNYSDKEIDLPPLEGLDAVVHLAGESLGTGRWTPERMRRFRDSRVLGTRFLSESFGKLSQPPKTFLCASGIGYYGDRADELLTERSAPGKGFLTELCIDWEAAAQAARRRGIRVAHLRLGLVLSPKGGVLKAMLPVFKMGLGAKLGTGRQYMSWITLSDLLSGILHCLVNETLADAVNFVTSSPITNASFTKYLGEALKRPTFFSVPPFALKLMFGSAALEALLASQRVLPEKLLAAGFSFRHPDLGTALQSILKDA